MTIKSRQWWKRKRTGIAHFVVEVDDQLSEVISWSHYKLGGGSETFRGSHDDFRNNFDYIGDGANP